MSTPATPFHKRPLWIAIAAFLALFLVGGGIAATGAFSGGGTTAAAPTAATTDEATSTDASSSPPPGGASVCGIASYEASGTLTSAPEVRWRLIGTFAAPASQEAGPGSTSSDGAFSTCFAHTPTGALLASINYYASLTDGRNTVRIPDLIAEGSFKQKLKDYIASSSPGPDGGRVQVSGFKIDQYSGDSATVDLAMSVGDSAGGASGTQLVSFPTVLKWEAGDWKVVFTDNGAPIAQAPLSSLGGYIPFRGA
ncbi:hypothetical protein [Clavibacter sp. VKM Ac-2542]|uniref:hypothetical protein n=1 Tax=Clavibacter sp. VKM Ac-2542 TaxID=2783811 RepID=UPI00188D5374|nr:hypothetical protein [Clavibacter sp. VKM Ac-2542]MBF4621829.1 hypothetical protein [Clavibacter sp. VKM Ac-2542]